MLCNLLVKMAVFLLPLFAAAVGVGILSSVFRLVERRIAFQASKDSKGLLNRVNLRVNGEYDYLLPSEWAIIDNENPLSAHDAAIKFCTNEG